MTNQTRSSLLKVSRLVGMESQTTDRRWLRERDAALEPR